jgi:PAS domain S-box-containing protein
MRQSSDLLLDDEDQRRLLRTLVALFFGILMVTFPIFFGAMVTGLMLPVILFVGIVTSYWLSRGPQIPLAVLPLIIAFGIGPFIQSFSLPTGPNTLPFTAVSILLSSLFLRDRFTVVLSLVIVLGIALLLILQPAFDVQTGLAMLVFIAMIAMLSLITNSIRRINRLRLAEHTRQLAEKELNYRLLAENSTDLITRHTFTGEYLYVSPASQRLLGYKPDEMLGRALYDFLHPDDLASTREAYNNMPLSSGVLTQSYRVRRKDESFVWFESTSRIVVTGARSPAHEITSVSRDITGRKLIENALRDSEALFRAAAEGSLDAFYLLRSQRDAGGKITDFIITEVNTAGTRLLGGLPRHAVVGGRLTELASWMHKLEYLERYVHVVETGETLEEDMEINDAEGDKPNWLHHQVVRVGDGLAVTTRDITDRKQAEEERLELAVQRERVQMLQHLISDTSHDLKTPLASLRTSIYLLQKFIANDERREHYAAMLQKQIAHLVRMLDDLSTMARMEDAKETFTFELLDISELLASIATEYEPLAAQKNQTLTYLSSPMLPSIPIDATKMRRAITNLVSNALNYTPVDGCITLRSGQRDDSVIVEVSDTGVGIGEDDLPHVFERFYRAERARDTDSSGTGLGLAITSKIVEAHRGHIEVDSQIGVGSTFRIVLPLSHPAIHPL